MPPISFPQSATIALCLLLTAPSTIAAVSTSALAQSPDAASFELPESVADSTVVRIDGSDSMRRINQALQQGFEAAYSGTEVQVAYSGTDAALSALEAGDIDLAAIGRPLTDEEKARGLRETVVERHKIALIVGPDNTFDGSLTTAQFAQIFRGEIEDWSVVGGEPGAIRLVDRPEDSDTRQAFRGYPVFKEAPFEAGAQTDVRPEDSTQAVIAALGEDGLGYAIAEQVIDNPNVAILPMHNTLPDDPRYPFSQPLTYVYSASPTPAARSFLGYATAPINESALEAARVEGAQASVEGSEAAAGAAAGSGTVAPDGEALVWLSSPERLLTALTVIVPLAMPTVIILMVPSSPRPLPTTRRPLSRTRMSLSKWKKTQAFPGGSCFYWGFRCCCGCCCDVGLMPFPLPLRWKMTRRSPRPLCQGRLFRRLTPSG